MRLCREAVSCGCVIGCVLWVCRVGVSCGCAVLSSTEKEASVLRGKRNFE